MSQIVDTVSRNQLDDAPRRSRWKHPLVVTLGVVLGLLMFLLVSAAIYTTTDDFQHRVGSEVVKVLEDSTGGRVELKHISFSLAHLAIEVDGLVIHGTEAPSEMPYLSLAKVFVNLRINTFITHIRGVGPQSHIGLSYLRVELPHVHLIIDKNGNTNQPTPKHPSTSTTPVQDTLLDLQAKKVELVDGLAVLNDRAIPFDLAAKNLNAEVHYIPKTDRYGATIDLGDLQTKMAAKPDVHSKLHVTGELGRDAAKLTSLDFTTGDSTHLAANAEVNHFAKPEWQAAVKGAIDLKQLGYLAGVDGLDAGAMDIQLNGHNCTVTPQVAQKRPKFWQRRSKLPPSAKVLPPDPDCKAGYLLTGATKIHGADYDNEYVRLHNINAGAQLHITPSELLFTSLIGTLPEGGSAEGVLKIENWLGEVPSDAPARSATTVAAATTANTTAKGIGAKPPIDSVNTTQVQRAHAYLTVTVNRIALRSIMEVTETNHYGDLGFDTAITGPVVVEWGGPATDISDTVQVQADLKLSPTGTVRKGALSNIPVSGAVLAHYDGKTEVVKISNVTFNTPETTLLATGILGVNVGDPLTNLQVNLQARNLGEFDQLLQTLGFEANGKKGSAAIPVVLGGTLGFTGTAKGAIRDLDVKGHVVADNLAVQLGTVADVHIDSVVADAEFSPYSGVAVADSTIKRNTAVLNVGGTFKPHRVVSRRGVVDYNWDNQVAIDATTKLANAQVSDLLQIAGQQKKVDLTGTVNLNAHLAGTVNDLNGDGNLSLANGEAYGENYQTLAVDFTARGQQIDASKLLVQAHGLTVAGSGGYNLTTKHINAQLAGNNLQLSKFDTFAKASPDADGVLSFTATANGTAEQPGLNAKLSLTNLVVQGKPIGEVSATATSNGSDVNYQLRSTLVGAQVVADGKTSLLGDYQTQAKLTLTGLDIGNAMQLFSPGSIKASSNIAGTVNVSGPLKTPKQLSGNAEFQTFDVKLQTIELSSAEPLRASLKSGIVTLDLLHITGQDTDLHASGTAQVFGDDNPQGGALNLNASGNVNMSIAHSLDPDLISSGKVTFKMAAEGRMKKPQLTGDVQVQNVNLAVSGIANGLSNMNGTLAFNEDRLDVKNLVATTGGGQLKIGGYLAYQKGFFADLTATGDAVRVRLYGLSSTATANFRLQGNGDSMQLSGNVLVTRFGVGPDVDFSAFSSVGTSIPPSPDAPTNKIRLDVHVTSAPQLDFQNSYAKLAGTVDLTVHGTLANPTILGRIQITEGSAKFAGTNYELQRGVITFSNPVRIDPTIDLDASARVENYDITIGVHGTISNLKPTYRSSPPLTEADIFNLLALGRTQEESQTYQEQQEQAGTDPTTNALLGGALNATVSSRVNKLFGAGSVKIDPTYVGTLGNSSARITVQEPISKQLTLVFATNVNQTAQELIQLQYRINQSTSLVATRDENGVFSIVYKIRKQYR
jgi:translocation and assembly module TamB